ncbi:sensor histidine kinase [Arsenicibacter rosenii]|uniref:Signal transduction histidine kinase internal region domain-containing protein n=1 Tax=Arsenicibacter rosenii TaxID=1750698 RepID=A0A1S2VG92_9BACT|nr:sensor histidine kinase [Arsenicibacter rosenii]OIN56918.1 hypothetical protein BLX24_22385 [Arsenicibacter rosenii]
MKQRARFIISHIGFGLAFLALPYIFAPNGLGQLGQIVSNPHELTNFLSYLLMLAFFYGHYYVLIPRFYFQERLLTYGLSIATCFIIIFGLLFWVDRRTVFSPMMEITRGPRQEHPPGHPYPEMPPPRPENEKQKPPVGFELSHSLFLFLVGVFGSLALQVNNRLRRTQQEKLNAELSYLKAQINPHFLFNTLNTIYALAIEKSDSTPEAIVELSALMRYVIRDAQGEQVPLARELEYINHYIALQKLRLGETVQIEASVTGTPNGRKITPLILISFIENAFKYGVNPQERSLIRIVINVGQDKLSMNVANKKLRLFYEEEMPGGIGVKNTKARLDLLYPNKHLLVITDTDTDYTVDLTIYLS